MNVWLKKKTSLGRVVLQTMTQKNTEAHATQTHNNAVRHNNTAKTHNDKQRNTTTHKNASQQHTKTKRHATHDTQEHTTAKHVFVLDHFHAYCGAFISAERIYIGPNRCPQYQHVITRCKNLYSVFSSGLHSNRIQHTLPLLLSHILSDCHDTAPVPRYSVKINRIDRSR